VVPEYAAAFNESPLFDGGGSVPRVYGGSYMAPILGSAPRSRSHLTLASSVTGSLKQETHVEESWLKHKQQ
jgi:hypothetical protein